MQCLATTFMTKKRDIREALKIEVAIQTSTSSLFCYFFIFNLQRAANKKTPIADEELVSKKNIKKPLVNNGKRLLRRDKLNTKNTT